jgi:hypothetical protein
MMKARRKEMKMTANNTAVKADILVANHGSLVILKPASDSGREWLDANIGEDNGYQPLWPSVVVEPRYVQAILEGASNDGLSLAEVR